MAQNVERLLAELADVQVRPGVGQLLHGRDVNVLQPLALLSASVRDEAEVVVGAPARVALDGEAADGAVARRLRIGLAGHGGGELLDAPGDPAMKRGVALELDGLLRAVVEQDESELRLEALDVGEEPVVQRELMDDLRLDSARELGVDDLV